MDFLLLLLLLLLLPLLSCSGTTSVFTGAEPSQGGALKLTVNTFKTDDGAQLLECEVLDAFPKPKVEWQDSFGNILPAEEPQITERGGIYDIILNTTVTKTGNYRCVIKQEEIGHQVYAEIFVHISGEELELTVNTFKTDDGAQLLRCEVRGASPKPKVEWQNSSGNILPAEEPQITERGDIYDIILNTTVTKTGNYRCVATQEEIGHQIHAETFVLIPVITDPEPSKGPPTGWIVGPILGVLLVGILLAVLYKKGLIKRKKDSQTETNGDENSPESVELNRNHDTNGV